MRRRNLLALLGSTATLSPLVVRAQQKTMPVIGYLGSLSPNPYLAAYLQGLSEMGYVEGQNVAIEYRFARGHVDRLPALAAELVGRKVDMIAAFGGESSAQAAKDATSLIPIVFLIGEDPVARGLVVSLAKPGGNLTGVTLLIGALYPKRLELLLELVPEAKLIALLVSPSGMNTEGVTKAVQDATRARNVRIEIWTAGSEAEIERAFAEFAGLHRPDALIVSATPLFDTYRDQLLALEARHAVPTIYAWRDFVANGGLISYGASLTGVHRQLGIYAGKILKGARPADLPVVQPTKFELVINLKTAKALGLTMPQSLLQRADEVIE